MSRLLRGLPLAGAVIAACLWSAPAAAADDPECDIILPAADDLEAVFDQIRPGRMPVQGTEAQIVAAQSPLFGLTSPAAVDLRLWSSTLAAEVNRVNPYRPAGPARIAADLSQARRQLAAARQFCR